MASAGKHKNLIFKGISINPGRVGGKLCLYSAERHKAVPEYALSTETEVADELRRFDEVLEQCSLELNTIAADVSKTIGKTEAEIFRTQKHIMNDPKLLGAVRNEVNRNHKNAEWAISEVLSSYEDQFARLDNQYLRERATDIGEIRRRLLSRFSNKKNGFMCQGQQHCVRGENRIIVAEELTPDMITSMNVEKVLGFVTEHGGLTSHAAIIARSLGIPAVSGITGIMEIVQCGDEMLMDADRGEVYLNPDRGVIDSIVKVEQVQEETVCILDSPAGTEVLANTSTLDDVRHARSVGADGIGLFRTEIVFIRAERLMSVDEQYTYYSQVYGEMGGKTVVFRLLDAGGDKPLPFLRIRKEANPSLGWRGARFLLGNRPVFEAQVQALGRVSMLGKIKIMFPMVVDAVQLKELVKQTREFLSGVEHDSSNIEIGAMFEIPSAFLEAREMFKLIDFGSIGSNDLIQYLFAIDRENELVSQDYNPDHPTLWNLLRSISSTARQLGKPLSICGEIAGREGFPTKLLESGIHSISVSPRLIPRVRNEMARYMNPAMSR